MRETGFLKWLFLCSAAADFSCTHFNAKSELSPDVNLAQYHTYAWSPPTTDPIVQSSADSKLAAMGLTPTQNQNPDFYITYSEKTTHYHDYNADQYMWEMPPPYNPCDRPYDYKEGTFFLNFVDAKTEKVFWRASATEILNDFGGYQKIVARALDQMLEKYPG